MRSRNNFVWDQSGPLPLLLQDASGSYIYGPGGQPVEQIDSAGTVSYFHQDQLGSTRALTDGSGNVAATYTYDSYGNLTSRTGTVTTPLQFAGEYTDAGFQYLRARYYDPATAQFLSRDPAVMQKRAAYGYVGGNPLNGADPTGRNRDVEIRCPDGSTMVNTYDDEGGLVAGESCDTAAVHGGAVWGGGGSAGMEPETNQQFDTPGSTTWANYADASTHAILAACQSLALYAMRAPWFIKLGVTAGEHGYHWLHRYGW